MPSESIRVLLVEDNLGDARLLYEDLEEALPGQFQMTHVRQLSEALEYLWKEPCHVVLLDLGLPDSHGIDTLILTRAQAPDVAIVVLTGFQDEVAGGSGTQRGCSRLSGQRPGRQQAAGPLHALRRRAQGRCRGAGRARSRARRSGVLRRSRQRLIAAHERVRREVAAQLHDDVQEKLLVLKSHVQELMKMDQFQFGRSSRTLPIIDRLNRTIEQQVGSLGRVLYPLGDGLVTAFQSLRDHFEPAAAIEVELDEELAKHEPADRSLVPEQVGLAAYRIAEEALTNVVKHAGAGKVNVRLDMSREGWLRLTVRDDGQGFNVQEPHPGLGLGIMQDYAEAVDGECSVHSDHGVGTEVAAVLPLAQPDAEQLEAATKGDNRWTC